MDNNYFPAFRPNNWLESTDLRKMRDNARPMDPKPKTREGDGLPIHDMDEYWHYRFDLMLDAESALRAFLGMLVDYHQTRLLEVFLLGFCDIFEVTFDSNFGSIPRFRFRIDLSDRLSCEYSTHHIGCLIWVDGRQDSLHQISIAAMDDLRQTIAELLPIMLQFPIWDVVKQDGSTVTLRRRTLIPSAPKFE